MERNPRNTAIFLLALFPQPANPQYRDNLCKTIQLIQDLGFEPYVVTPHDELLVDCNLFVKTQYGKPLLETILEHRRDYNLLLWDNFVFNPAEMEALIYNDLPFAVYVTNMGDYIAYALYEPGKDWVDFLSAICFTKKGNRYSKYAVTLETVTKMEFQCPDMIPLSPPPAT